jgi:NitT/TauT family transport system substrate-binding protein
LVVAPESPVRAAHDLNGKTISVPALNDSNTLATMSWLDQNGGDAHSVQFLEVPASAAVAALAQGRIAAATLVRPFLSQALAAGTVRVVANVFAAIAREYLQTAWFTTAAYAAAHRDAIERFARVASTAGVYANSHHDETAVALAAFSGVDLGTITEADRGIYAGGLDARQVQPLIDAAARYAMIPRRFDAAEMLLR